MISDERLKELIDLNKYQLLEGRGHLSFEQEYRDIISGLEELQSARRKIALLKEDAEELYSWFGIGWREHSTKCYRYREADDIAECTCGYQNTIDKHKQVMKEVE